MPYIKKKQKERAYIPKKIRQPTSDQDFLNSPVWRKARSMYLRGSVLLDQEKNPLCEVCTHAGRRNPAVELDHIIARSQGGAKLDARNFCAMCRSCHSRKSGKESHNPILVDYIDTRNGKIPKNKTDILNLLS